MHDAALPSSDGVSSYCRFLNSELQAGGSQQLRPRPGPVANNSPRHVQNVRAANSWFLICLVKIPFKRSLASTVRRHIFLCPISQLDHQTSSLVDGDFSDLGSIQCQPMDRLGVLRADTKSASREDVGRAAFFARIPRSDTRFSGRTLVSRRGRAVGGRRRQVQVPRDLTIGR